MQFVSLTQIWEGRTCRKNFVLSSYYYTDDVHCRAERLHIKYKTSKRKTSSLYSTFRPSVDSTSRKPALEKKRIKKKH